jgi:hypothetical protein
MRLTFPYLILRGGSYSYRRRVPADLREFYPSDFIVQSLKTRDKKTAMVRGEAINSATERLWEDLRDPEKTIIAQGQLKSKPTLDQASLREAGFAAGMLWNLHRYVEKDEPVEPPTPEHTISDALELYLGLHENGTNKRFIHDMHLVIDRVIAVAGDKPLAAYTRQDARKVSETFLASMKSTSARVYINKISAVINKAKVEWQLSCVNPFSSLDIRNEGDDAKVVEDFTLPELEKIAAACLHRDDDVAWVVALQLATGANRMLVLLMTAVPLPVVVRPSANVKCFIACSATRGARHYAKSPTAALSGRRS